MNLLPMHAEVVATEHEIKARIADFDAACIRDETAGISRAHTAALVALEKHLESKAALTRALLAEAKKGSS